MAGKRFSKWTAVSLGGVVAASPLIAACGSGASYDNWAATDGAAGRINLDDVQEAFKDSKSATEFEEKVNKIYEGDGLVLIRAKQDGENLTLVILITAVLVKLLVMLLSGGQLDV